MGSVGVIISTLLIEWFGWTVADPLCSLALSIMIILSVVPLLQSSSRTLAHATPDALKGQVPLLLERLERVDGVLGARCCSGQ